MIFKNICLCLKHHRIALTIFCNIFKKNFLNHTNPPSIVYQISLPNIEFI